MSRIISMTVIPGSSDSWDRTFAEVSQIATDLDKAEEFDYVSVSASKVSDVEDEEPQLYHDEDTLRKVRDGIRRALQSRLSEALYFSTVADGMVIDIISEIQNEGILFRERR